MRKRLLALSGRPRPLRTAIGSMHTMSTWVPGQQGQLNGDYISERERNWLLLIPMRAAPAELLEGVLQQGPQYLNRMTDGFSTCTATQQPPRSLLPYHATACEAHPGRLSRSDDPSCPSLTGSSAPGAPGGGRQ